MSTRTTVAALVAPIAATTVLLAGCGSSGKTGVRSTPLTPTATMIGRGTPPVTGSTSTSKGKRASTVATGRHNHAGQPCSGRDQAPYADEGLTCVTGRLKPTK